MHVIGNFGHFGQGKKSTCFFIEVIILSQKTLDEFISYNTPVKNAYSLVYNNP